jgi:hypothetical protein
MKKTASQIADEVLEKVSALQRKDVPELAEDLGTQMAVYGPEAAAGAVPSELLKRRIREIESGSDKQTLVGLGGGAAGGLLGGGFGALTTGLAKGKKFAPVGAVSAIPGALLGYGYLKDLQRKRELKKALEEQL